MDMLILFSLIIVGTMFFGFAYFFKKSMNKVIKVWEEQQRQLVERVKSIVEGKKTLTPADFFEIRKCYRGHLEDFDFMGCYVIHNVTKNMYYVGQAKHVPNRVYAHFTGSGNGDVYADYRYNNKFEIILIDIMTTNYRRLDDLERDLITAYNAYNCGYNKTRGNR